MDLTGGGQIFQDLLQFFQDFLSNFSKYALNQCKNHQFLAQPTLAYVTFPNFFKLAPPPQKIPGSTPGKEDNLLVYSLPISLGSR